MPRPTRDELAAYANAPVDDLAGGEPRLVFVGINPGLWTAATNTPFARPGNRFWPALVAAGLIRRPVDPAAGLTSAERRHIIERGIAITNFVNRATARADELNEDEISAGAIELHERLLRWKPQAVAVLGITAYRQGFHRPGARRGRQPLDIAGIPTFLFGNPSGLNAHETVQSLAEGFGAAAQLGGITPLRRIRH